MALSPNRERWRRPAGQDAVLCRSGEATEPPARTDALLTALCWGVRAREKGRQGVWDGRHDLP